MREPSLIPKYGTEQAMVFFCGDSIRVAMIRPGASCAVDFTPAAAIELADDIRFRALEMMSFPPKEAAK
jgi:hypothetical protein